MIVDVAKISSRGQIAIPADIRHECGLKEGDKIIFMARGEEIVMKKSSSLEKFFEVSEPLLNAKKKIKENEVVDLIHELRKRRRVRH